ncbi:putative manganese transporter [Qiania dongpingensis]|uniref:Arsenic efflux protein n=1 Tax=Qiania dongpingensis TaxID=2763669 RepID=A0A7G9G497_9FIRM|nr:putative manganese transporter [Qiania dongpingensis]QNM05629.1 arsenic efflux protein [Qiania dongpingensis]
MDYIIDALKDGLWDTVKMLPFLFAAFLILEVIEHYSEKHRNGMLTRIGGAGPLVGALFGCIPQCGFSVAAANLYSGGVITVGTLLAVFLSTSDEAVLLILGNPGNGAVVIRLLAIKVVIGVLFGYAVDILLRKSPMKRKQLGNICDHCGCEEEGGVLRAAVRHTIQIFLYLLLFNCVLNLLLEAVGIETLSRILMKDSLFQPVLAGLVGLIPNCAASVALTELYLSGVLSFGSVIAGLCASAGIGLAVLFRVNKNGKENLKILGILFLCSIIAGMLLQAVM